MIMIGPDGRIVRAIGMRERARSLGGEVAIESWLRRGTTVTVRLPIR